MNSHKRKGSYSKGAVGTSLSNALLMVTVTVINLCSRNKSKKLVRSSRQKSYLRIPLTSRAAFGFR